MRDEMDARMWEAHHEAFGQWVDRAAATIRSRIARLPTWDGTTHQLLALVVSFVITALTFNTTAA